MKFHCRLSPPTAAVMGTNAPNCLFAGLMKSVVVHFALLLKGFSDHGSFHFKEIFKGKVLLRGVSFFSVGNTNDFIAAGKYEHDVA